MPRRALLLALASGLGVALIVGVAASASPSPSAARYVLIERLTRAVAGLDSTGATNNDQQGGRGTSELGELNLAGGLNADVWAYKNVAYVGTWSGPCPGTGVKIIDVACRTRLPA